MTEFILDNAQKIVPYTSMAFVLVVALFVVALARESVYEVKKSMKENTQ